MEIHISAERLFHQGFRVWGLGFGANLKPETLVLAAEEYQTNTIFVGFMGLVCTLQGKGRTGEAWFRAWGDLKI